MEDRMDGMEDSKGWGKLQLIGDSSHTAQHTVGAHPALAKLPPHRKR